MTEGRLFVPEQNTPPTERYKTNIYPYALRLSDRVIAELDMLFDTPTTPSDADVDVVGVCMGIKSAGSVLATGKLTPFTVQHETAGGSSLKEMYHKLSNQTTLYTVPYDDKSFAQNERVHIGGSFVYEMTRKNGDPTPHEEVHTTSIFSIPAIAPRVIQGHILDPERRNFDDITTIPVSRFEEALKTGTFTEGDQTREIIESSAYTIPEPNGPVRIQPEQAQVRDQELEQLIGFVKEKDAEYKAAIVHRIQMEEERNGRTNVYIDEKSLLKQYKSLSDRYGRDSARSRIQSVIRTMHADLYSTYFRRREAEALATNEPLKTAEINEKKARAERLKKLMRQGTYGIDILHLLPIAVQEADVSYTTRTFADFEELFKDIYDNAQKAENVNYREMMHVRTPRTANMRVENSTRVHNTSIKEIASLFGYTPEYVETCWTEAMTVVPTMGNSLKAADEEFYALLGTKVHELTNEVHNADLPEMYYLYKHSRNIRVRFEAGRQLAVFMHELAVRETYDHMRAKRNKLLSTVVDDYFGPDEGRIIWIGKRIVPLRYSEPTGHSVVVDEKQAKSRESFSRKAWSKTPEQSAGDIHGYSIILDEMSVAADETPEDAVNSLYASFTEYVKLAYGRWYDIEINEPDVTGINNYSEYINDTNPEVRKAIAVRLKDGKNTGSSGNGIVRLKTSIRLTSRENPDDSQVCEFSFYPYANISPDALVDGFMGWDETLNTHRAYEVRRLLHPLNGTAGTRSLYDLMFPAAIYPDTHSVRAVAVGKEGRYTK